MTRIFFSAGEASGDIHGANLIRALREQDHALECEGLGGHRMADAGMALHVDLAGRAIMGFTEVVRSLGFIRRTFREAVAWLERARPDALVLIDYPGFNIELAKKAKVLRIPVVYYISPQVWAWKKGRIRTIAQLVEKVLVILPFEQPLYATAGVSCVHVGHPLLDHIASVPILGKFRDQLVVGLLPGSREQEILRLLGTMLRVAEGIRAVHPEARFIVPCVDAAREAQVRQLAGAFPVETAIGETYELLSAARFCLVASGTATLETALFGVPMVILYRVSRGTYWIARRLVDVDHIGMVNILAGRRIVPEFIQDAARPENVLSVALELIDESPARNRMLEDLAEVRSRLGGPGASVRAAAEIVQILGSCRSSQVSSPDANPAPPPNLRHGGAG